jgi:hypothetical protein
LPISRLYIFAWETKINKNRRLVTGTNARRILAKYLKENSTPSTIEKMPKIDKLLVYNDYEVGFCVSVEEDYMSLGYITSRGQSIIFGKDGEPKISGDKTVFSLLRDILSSNELLYNRFLIDLDETRYSDILPHKDAGYEKIFDLRV